jgi:uncharacterized Tic20 family protein
MPENSSDEPDSTSDSTGLNAGPDPVESGADSENNEAHPPALTEISEEPPARPWEPFPLPGKGELSESEDRTWGMLCHLMAFAGLLLPTLGNIIGPLVVWLIKKDVSPFVDAHGKESLNFQISISIYLLVGGVLTFIYGAIFSLILCFGSLLTIFLGVALSCLGIFAIVYQIVAGVRANEGGFLRYPITIRFFR